MDNRQSVEKRNVRQVFRCDIHGAVAKLLGGVDKTIPQVIRQLSSCVTFYLARSQYNQMVY